MKLYADAVQSIFAFMRMPQLMAAARCSRQWYSFAASMHTRRDGVRLQQSADAIDIGISPPSSAPSLRHHIRTLDCAGAVSDLPGFLLFLQSFPRLQRVQVLVSADVMSESLAALTVGEDPLRLPSTLLEFRVVLALPQFTDAHRCFLQLIVRLAATAPMLHTFAWRNVKTYALSYGPVDFKPLLTLPNLTELSLQFRPSGSQLALLSDLRAIRRLRFPALSTILGSYNETIHHFGQKDGQLPVCEWLDIGDAECRQREIDSLAKVASLTRLPSAFIDDSGLLRLHTLPQALRRFNFAFERSDDPDEVHPDPIAVLLECAWLSSLQHLSLSRVYSLTSAPAELLASRLPQLRILQLSHVMLWSLSWFQHLSALEQLSLTESLRMCPSGDLCYIAALPRLRRFHCMVGFPDLDVAALTAQLADPTSVYARFQCFQYMHQQRDGRWITLATPGSHCPKPVEFSLNPDKDTLECCHSWGEC